MIPCLLPPSPSVPSELDLALPTALSPGDRRPRSLESGMVESKDSRPEALALTIAKEVESFYSPSGISGTSGSRMTSSPLGMCLPQKATAFQLKIRFQQLSDPVPAKFSLNTQFLLLKKNLGSSSLESRGAMNEHHSHKGSKRTFGFTSTLESSSVSEEAFLPGKCL